MELNGELSEMSGCYVWCPWGERASHTFPDLLISPQRLAQLLLSHILIILLSRSMLPGLSSPWDEYENCTLCFFLETCYLGSLFKACAQ